MKENLYEVWRVESDGRRRELMYTAHRIRPIGAAGLAKFRLDRLHFYYYYCYCSTSAACASVIGGDWVWKRGEWNNHKRLDGGGRERERGGQWTITEFCWPRARPERRVAMTTPNQYPFLSIPTLAPPTFLFWLQQQKRNTIPLPAHGEHFPHSRPSGDNQNKRETDNDAFRFD